MSSASFTVRKPKAEPSFQAHSFFPAFTRSSKRFSFQMRLNQSVKPRMVKNSSNLVASEKFKYFNADELMEGTGGVNAFLRRK